MGFGKGFSHGFSYSIEGGRLALLSGDIEKKSYDPDLLYVECRVCGKPVVWEPGKTMALIDASGIDIEFFDEYCLLLSDGCPACRPEVLHFNLHLVRLTSLSSAELRLLGNSKGNA